MCEEVKRAGVTGLQSVARESREESGVSLSVTM